jgi:hypothetical protein
MAVFGGPPWVTAVFRKHFIPKDLGFWLESHAFDSKVLAGKHFVFKCMARIPGACGLSC